MISRVVSLPLLLFVSSLFWAPWQSSSLRAVEPTYVLVSLAGEGQIATLQNKEDGTLTELTRTETGGRPAAMGCASDGSTLYVALREVGAIVAFSIGQDGALSKLGQVDVAADPSYLQVDPSGHYLLSASYAAGQVTVHEIQAGGRLSSQPKQTVVTDEKAHAVVFDPSGRYVFVPHTRPNKIFQFHFDAQTGTLTGNQQAVLQHGANTGPRHLWFHPTRPWAFGSDEQGSSITRYQFDPKQGTLQVAETMSTLPEGYSERNSTSDIEVHPSGRYVYVANRGHDTIAGFSIDPTTGKLTALPRTKTETTTRSFNITRDGAHLIAAGQKSNHLAVFDIRDDGSLERTQTLPIGKTPWWVVALDR